jgi:hypothetical protein
MAVIPGDGHPLFMAACLYSRTLASKSYGGINADVSRLSCMMRITEYASVMSTRAMVSITTGGFPYWRIHEIICLSMSGSDSYSFTDDTITLAILSIRCSYEWVLWLLYVLLCFIDEFNKFAKMGLPFGKFTSFGLLQTMKSNGNH